MSGFYSHIQGPFLSSKAFLPALKKSSNTPKIINISSDMASIAGKFDSLTQSPPSSGQLKFFFSFLWSVPLSSDLLKC
jgi:NAD(P)-dependent dehydrogenase (short-subunit alcohol dehydrogenase family)